MLQAASEGNSFRTTHFFEVTLPLSKDQGAAGVVPVRGSNTPATSISSAAHSGTEGGMPEGPYSKLLQPTSRKASSFITWYDVTFKPVSHLPLENIV